MLVVLLLSLVLLAAAGTWFAVACARADARAAGEPDPVPEHLARTAWARSVDAAEALAAHVPVPARRRVPARGPQGS